jgi:hypothetical protein
LSTPKKQKRDDDHEDVEPGRIAAEIEAASAEQRRYQPKIGGAVSSNRSFCDGNSTPRARFVCRHAARKTEALAYESACHLTGEYPPDWPGSEIRQARFASGPLAKASK